MGQHRRVMAAALGLAAAGALAPAGASAAGLIAAYDRYQTGRGFEIGIVNAATGATVAVPAGVNTADDELHPTLSADGRFMAFTRMKLLPKLNGDIVPPATRTLHWVDLQTGQITSLGSGSGPVLTSKTAVSSTLAWGIAPQAAAVGATFPEGSTTVALFTGLGTVPPTGSSPIRASVPATNLFVPHAATIEDLFSEDVFTPGCQPCRSSRTARYLTLATHDPITGALTNGVARLSLFGLFGGVSNQSRTERVLEFGTPGAPGGHPVPRSGDGYVALDLTTGDDVNIHSITYPGETQTTPTPEPITTAAAERMPAWSPDGLSLGFVRTDGGRRKLGVFDATPGLQTIVNPLVDLGADAPTPQTRAFQSVWGGISLAPSPAAPAPAVGCIKGCLSNLADSSTVGPIQLSPIVSTSRKGQKIGIFVVRVTGERKLLGRTLARIRVIGRVPLGATRKGINTFSWDGKVDGKRLGRGTYLLTYRALKRERVISTSRSIRFTVTKDGEVGRVRRER